MSKIGRRPIPLHDVQVHIQGQEVHYKGKHGDSVHVLPKELKAEVKDDKLYISAAQKTSDTNRLWGLHRALLANEITGVSKGFERELEISGLGYKGVLSGNKIVFSLGYSHKIDFPLPKGITVEIDKTGQNIKVKGYERELVGLVCSRIRSLREPEPYKETGIKFAKEKIIRKAGKTKSA